MRFGVLRGLARPIDRGARVRGRRLFGDNKTYRGIVAVGLGTALGFALLAEAQPTRNLSALLGLGVGAAAMLSELPNSFLKRQLEIDPGEQARGLRGAFFHVLDQVDVLVGGWLVLSLAVSPSAARIAGSLLFVYLGHQLLTAAGYLLGMRSTWR